MRFGKESNTITTMEMGYKGETFASQTTKYIFAYDQDIIS